LWPSHQTSPTDILFIKSYAFLGTRFGRVLFVRKKAKGNLC
jgi:hypothetical protein